MSEWKAKRFWTEATVAATPDGFQVLLDGKGVRTPQKSPLVLPTKALAQAVADEWQAQTGVIDPRGMPVTRTANSALDKVAPQRAEVVQMLADYGASDLLCYRANGPARLVAQQSDAWDPWLVWAANALDAPLTVNTGVMPVPQPLASLDRLHDAVDALSDFELAGFHDLVVISGSLVLALAVLRGKLAAEDAWRLSRIDEDWQIAQWGEDEEATALANRRQADFHAAARFYALCQSN